MSASETPPVSFFERLKLTEATKLKRLLGYYIASELVKSGDGVVVFSGTTPCLAAEQIMSKVEDVSIYTTSIPVLWAAMNLNQENRIARGVSLRALGGDTHLMTGLICNANFRGINAGKLIYSPRSLTPRGIEGNHDIPFIQGAIAAAKEIIFPITDDKLGRRGDVVIKHLGHIAKESAAQKRLYTIVLPHIAPSLEHEEPAKSILSDYREAGVRIIRLRHDFTIPANASNLFGSQ